MNDKDTYRMHTKVIQIGDRKIGGGNPIAIQSMTNTKTEDVKATVEQILRLERAGCEITAAQYRRWRRQQLSGRSRSRSTFL